MPDVFNQEKRSEVMASIRGRGNQSTEIRLIALMRESGIIGWRRGSTLPGKPDFVFSQVKLVVFVDGDFWHGHPVESRIPQGNRTFWLKKIESNRKRDRKVNRILKLNGWRVIRFWESSLKKRPASCLSRLRRAMQKSLRL
jgi:DNA mismatch endonuclease (patch repair protein)